MKPLSEVARAVAEAAGATVHEDVMAPADTFSALPVRGAQEGNRTLECNNCGRSVPVGGVILVGTTCSIWLGGSNYCHGKFSPVLKPIPEPQQDTPPLETRFIGDVKPDAKTAVLVDKMMQSAYDTELAKQQDTPGQADGVALIRAERLRQVAVEGWSPEHDDEHDGGALATAASCYVRITKYQWVLGNNEGTVEYRLPAGWPREWGPEWWKPSKDPIRNLVKAGALIAAEIDRLQRISEPTPVQDGGTE